MTTQAEFAERCAAAAADLALFFVDAPDDQMLAALYQVRADMEAKLVTTFGADVAALVAQAFVAAVVGHRREIEAAGGTSRVLN
jgi:hypothetical protein